MSVVTGLLALTHVRVAYASKMRKGDPSDDPIGPKGPLQKRPSDYAGQGLDGGNSGQLC